MTTGIFTHESCYRHLTAKNSPESPDRITAIEDRLVASGLLSAFKVIKTHRRASQKDLLRAHDADYIRLIQSKVPAREGELVQVSEDTTVSRDSFESALESAGCVLEACDRVMQGALQNAFCCVRPPGHHAHRHKAGGFCLFNNVAIAALYAQAALSCRRVAILDFDVHHGDGTENIVQGREGIEFYSIYQEGIFPHIKQDNHADNIHAYALEAGDTGDDACDIIRSEWGPRLQSFAPDLILISAGFDAHANDTMAQLDFSDLDYAHITRIIKDIAHAVCGGRLVSVLEGGYEPRSLARAVLAHVRTLADL